ncbi:MAG TPA: TonB-dependent receptor, partial [Gemmatimonadaceae bacterium]|nr:TonB-dependent receptor [Gemmatimonadaceae bacterium]
MPALTAAVVLGAFAPVHAPAQTTQRDVLAGHITGPNGPIPGATVSVLAANAPAGTFAQTARTDAEGRWLVAVQEGTGDYVVRITAIGMVPKSVTAKRGEARKPIIVDVKMEQAVVELGPVRVVEQRRQRPPRAEGLPERVGSDRAVDGFPGAIAVGDQGNLAAMAASVPGVTLVPDAGGGIPGFSVLGLSADQNRVTLNGMSFSGGDIPRDAMVATRVASTSYDVSRGGFSGGQLSISANSGGNFSQRLAHLTFDSRSLQATDAVGRELGAPYNNTQISGAASGPIVFDKVFYNLAAQIGRRSSDLQSLVTSDAFVLQRVGVSRDSVARLLNVLGTRGVPFSTNTVPADRLTDNVSLLGRLDWTPSPTKVGNVVGSVRRNVARASFLGATAVPGHGGDLTTKGADVTGTFSAYLPNNYLNDLRVGAHVNSSNGDPYVGLPDIRVLVSSQFADSTNGNATLQFGGNAALPRVARTSGAEV